MVATLFFKDFISYRCILMYLWVKCYKGSALKHFRKKSDGHWGG